MEKLYYFCLTQESGEHIGVVQANTNEELNDKISLACSEHFDFECVREPINKILVEDLLYGKEHTIEVKSPDEENAFVTIVRSFLY